MTRSDQWRKRPATTKYWKFKDILGIIFPDAPLPHIPVHVHFIFAMPKSWSGKKKAVMAGKPMLQKPDRDNLEKAYLDALYGDDSTSWDGRTSKWWGVKGAIIVVPIDAAEFPLNDSETGFLKS